MNIPKELIEQWLQEAPADSDTAISTHIAQRAAEWALSNVSMEPVAYLYGRTIDSFAAAGYETCSKDEQAYGGFPVFTADQLAAARQQGADDWAAMNTELKHVIRERDTAQQCISDLEKSNAQLLEALKRVRNMCTPELSHQETLMCKVIDSAIAEVKP